MWLATSIDSTPYMAYPFESDWGLLTLGRLRRALHKVVALPNVPLPDLLRKKNSRSNHLFRRSSLAAAVS